MPCALQWPFSASHHDLVLHCATRSELVFPSYILGMHFASFILTRLLLLGHKLKQRQQMKSCTSSLSEKSNNSFELTICTTRQHVVPRSSALHCCDYCDNCANEICLLQSNPSICFSKRIQFPKRPQTLSIA